MAYGHAERNLALIRQLETETRKLLGSLNQLDPEQSAWLQEATGPRRQASRGRHRLAQCQPRTVERRLGNGFTKLGSSIAKTSAGPSPARLRPPRQQQAS